MPAKGFRMKRDNIINPKFYKKFVEDTGSDISYKDFKNVIVETNKEIAKAIIEGNDGCKLPNNLGILTVNKYKTSTKGIDWINSNKYKKRIYHLNLHSYGYRFNIKWFKIDITRLTLAGVYKYKACRKLRRAVAAEAKNPKGNKYFEWRYPDFYQSTRLERFLMKRNKNKE